MWMYKMSTLLDCKAFCKVLSDSFKSSLKDDYIWEDNLII